MDEGAGPLTHGLKFDPGDELVGWTMALVPTGIDALADDCISLLGDDVVYVDIGASDGEVFLNLLASGFPIEEAHLIDASPETSGFLRERINGSFPGSTLHIHNLVFGSRVDTIPVTRGPGRARVVMPVRVNGHTQKPPRNQEQIRCTTLDRWCDSVGCSHISLLRVNVGGAEADVLSGARSLLERHAIDALSIELTLRPDDPIIHDFPHFEELLHEFGYTRHRVYERPGGRRDPALEVGRVQLLYLSPALAVSHTDGQIRYGLQSSEIIEIAPDNSASLPGRGSDAPDRAGQFPEPEEFFELSRGELQAQLETALHQLKTWKRRTEAVEKQVVEAERRRKLLRSRLEKHLLHALPIQKEYAQTEAMHRDILWHFFRQREMRQAVEARLFKLEQGLTHRWGNLLLRRLPRPQRWLDLPFALWRAARKYRKKKRQLARQLRDRPHHLDESRSLVVDVTESWQTVEIPPRSTGFAVEVTALCLRSTDRPVLELSPSTHRMSSGSRDQILALQLPPGEPVQLVRFPALSAPVRFRVRHDQDQRFLIKLDSVASVRPREQVEAQQGFNFLGEFVSEERRQRPVDRVDVCIVTTLNYPGGNASSTMQELETCWEAGLTTKLIHCSSSPLAGNIPDRFAPVYDVIDDIHLHDHQIACSLLIVRHPKVICNPALREITSRIDADHAVFVINNSMFKVDGSPVYKLKRLRRILEGLNYGSRHLCPMGPVIREELEQHWESQELPLSPMNWSPTFDNSQFPARTSWPENENLVIGRHSRDCADKWIEDPVALSEIYPERDDVRIRVLGGAGTPIQTLGRQPSNWEVLPFGSVHPAEFLAELDVFVFFPNTGWREAFGRTVMEAMMIGVPCILPVRYRQTFGENAFYCKPEEVVPASWRLMSTPEWRDAFVARARQRGLEAFGSVEFLGRLAQVSPELGAKLKKHSNQPAQADRDDIDREFRSYAVWVESGVGSPPAMLPPSEIVEPGT